MASKRLRDAVGIDPDRVVSAALEAALGEIEQPRKKRHPGRVLVAGAALAAAATAGQRHIPRMARLPLRMGLHKLGDMTHVDELADALHDRADALRDRLVGNDDDRDDADLADEEEFDDAPDDELPDDSAEEDLDDAEEDLDDEDDFDDEDEDEGGEDFDDEPEDDGPRDEGDAEEPEGDEELDDEPEDDSEDDLPEDEDEDAEDVEDVDDEEDLPPEEDEEDDEEIAARGLDLGVSSRDGGPRDRAPDLFESLLTRPRRAPVLRRALRVDPATSPPEPATRRQSDGRRGSSRKSKPKSARA